MKEKILTLLGIIGLILVISAIGYITVSITVTKGFYSYQEIELKTTEENIEYAVIILGSEDIWEKQMDKPMGVYKEKINVYLLTDEVMEKYKLKVRETTIYEIDGKYYYRLNLFQRAF